MNELFGQALRRLVSGPVAAAAAALAIALSTTVPAAAAGPAAGSEIIAGWDACFGQLFVMKPDGSSRRVIATSRRADDMSRRGPLTALIAQLQDPSVPYSPAVLLAIDVATGSATTLMTGPYAANSTFSPDASRIAFVHYNQHGWDPDGPAFADLYVADVVRDTATQAVIGLAGITRVVDLFTIGQRADTNASDGAFWSGYPEFSRNGTSIVVVAYDDLWRIDMAGSAMIGATPLTRTKASAERTPRWSPVGRDVIAYGGGPYTSDRRSGYTSLSVNENIYTLDLLAGTVRTLITKTNQGTAGSLQTSPTWSPDATYIAFSAPGPRETRKSSCGVNFDIFKIRSDGSGSAVNLTMTTDTGVEHDSHWGWQ